MPAPRRVRRSEEDEQVALGERGDLQVGGDQGGVKALEVVRGVRGGEGQLERERSVLTKSSPLLFHPFAAFNAWLDTELSAGRTACCVSLTPVIVSVYGDCGGPQDPPQLSYLSRRPWRSRRPRPCG